MDNRDLARLKQAVFNNRPVLGEILAEHGKKPLLDYARSYKVSFFAPEQLRKNQAILAVESEAKKFFGQAMAKEISEQLAVNYFVSTADHHGPLVHPFFVGSNLLAAVLSEQEQGLKQKYVLVLACGNVSLGNSSYPRGLLYHNRSTAGVTDYYLPIFPSSRRQAPVFGHAAFNKADLSRVSQKLEADFQKGLLARGAYGKISEVLERVYGSSPVLDQENYSGQVSLSNFQLWRMFFSKNRPKLPELIYLQMEDIVIKLLLDYHLFFNTEIAALLFDQNTRNKIEQYFNGIPGAFSSGSQTGTFLFWALPRGEKYRKQLWPKGDSLVARDGSYKVGLNPEELRDALLKGEIIPNIMLSLLTLSVYHGLKCLGGFSQVQYLTSLHKAYADLFGYKPPSPAHSQNLCADFMLAFMRTEENPEKLFAATGLDLVVYDSTETWQNFKKTVSGLTLEEALLPMFPEFYNMLHHKDSQNPVLANITERDVLDFCGLRPKIFPLGVI